MGASFKDVSFFLLGGLIEMRWEKKWLVCGLISAMALSFSGCGGTAEQSADSAKETAAQTENLTGQVLRVYCGAGMQKPFQKIADAFKEKTGCDVQVTYANAAQIQTQIKTAQEGDFFIAGSEQEVKPVQESVKESKALVKHIPVLAVSKGNPKGIDGLKSLTRSDVRVVMGDAQSTAIGKLSEKVFQDAGIKEALHITSTTTTAPQMATLLSLQEADAAILWKENCGDGVEIVPTEEMKPYIKTIPAARLKFQPDNRAADAFSAFLDSDEAHAIWTSFGYELAS